jgi:hypothetical protein
MNHRPIRPLKKLPMMLVLATYVRPARRQSASGDANEAGKKAIVGEANPNVADAHVLSDQLDQASVPPAAVGTQTTRKPPIPPAQRAFALCSVDPRRRLLCLRYRESLVTTTNRRSSHTDSFNYSKSLS